jgi:hypothetical protein
MSIKGAMNITATMTVIIGLLFAYLTWSANRWVDKREEFEQVHARQVAGMADRVLKLETESGERWKRVEEKLLDIKESLIELKQVK